MDAIYHSGSRCKETGEIFLHGFQTNEVDGKWMATFGSERVWVWEADRDRLDQQTLDSRPRLLSAAEGRRRPRLGKES